MNLPQSVAAYWVLAALVAEARSWGHQLRPAWWQQPWSLPHPARLEGHTRHLQFAAAGCLVGTSATGTPLDYTFAMITDFGTTPVRRYLNLRRRLRQISEHDWHGPPLEVIIVSCDPTESDTRPRAWARIAHSSAEDSRGRIGLRILTWQKLAERCHRIARLARYASAPSANAFPRQLDELVMLACRHPFLSESELAALLYATTARVRRLVQAGISQGLIAELPVEATQRAGIARDVRLVHGTGSGRRLAVQHLLLRSAMAARYQGIATDRHRASLLRTLAHTVGVNAVFVAFARGALASGGHNALVDWRSAAACARGRCRPDGYGVYRHRGRLHGFFLEFDRGTERAREYASKLRSYYYYRDSGAAGRDFDSFPAILVVTTSPAAEERMACQAVVVARQRNTSPLPLMLTTTARINANPEGILGRVWLSPYASRSTRAYWIEPGTHGSSSPRVLAMAELRTSAKRSTARN